MGLRTSGASRGSVKILRFMACCGVLVAAFLCGMTCVRAQQAVPGLPATVNGGKPVELKVFDLPNSTDAFSIRDKVHVAVAQAFLKRYPNITLTNFTFLKVPAAGGDSAIYTDTDTLMSMAAGTAPDVLYVNSAESDTFIRQGFLLPWINTSPIGRCAPGGQAELDRTFPEKRFGMWSSVPDPMARRTSGRYPPRSW